MSGPSIENQADPAGIGLTSPFQEGTMNQTRKLVAIFASDVADYSRLMGEDEAGAVKLVRERRR
jgi:class 3 adenylate cyclase